MAFKRWYREIMNKLTDFFYGYPQRYPVAGIGFSRIIFVLAASTWIHLVPCHVLNDLFLDIS